MAWALDDKRDHPRACGEHGEGESNVLTGTGSSPRMRGTPTFLDSVEDLHGIIPAHAGNTVQTDAYIGSDGDHPRACGEHYKLDLRLSFPMGSSPRMRGTPVPRPSVPRPSGIIPAHAGNTFVFQCVPFLRRDHPRACGEHPGISPHSLRRTGSSPRMRGTQKARLVRLALFGIIPAHAGNTGVHDLGGHVIRDHPRACGEHPSEASEALARLGIIPAHAGNTVRQLADDMGYGDHPRACGEHSGREFGGAEDQGSSPRMRGTLVPVSDEVRRIGIIPAHAGNT